jgi:protoporphyrinogen oxidase
MKKIAVIIGAGPAGLTAGLEFLRRSEITPVLLEASREIGGISRTIRYKGNRMDIGGKNPSCGGSARSILAPKKNSTKTRNRAWTRMPAGRRTYS